MTSRHITVALIASVASDLDQLQERTSLSRTDLTNRAITSYAFLENELRAGNTVIVRNNVTGQSHTVQLM